MAIKGEEFNRIIKALGVSQAKAGEFLGFTTRQSRRIAASQAELSTPAEKLVRVMLHCGLTVDAVNEIAKGASARRKKTARVGAAA